MTRRQRPSRPARIAVAALALASIAAPGAAAHDGPPYPILVDQPTGPFKLSAWADPDVGVGTFHVYLEPREDGEALPEDSEVRIWVQPTSGRLEEVGYDAHEARSRVARQHFIGEVEFDHQEWWNVRIEAAGAGDSGVITTEVEVTPPGQGPVWDFTLYLFPFVAIGVLVIRGLLTARSQPRAGQPTGAR